MKSNEEIAKWLGWEEKFVPCGDYAKSSVLRWVSPTGEVVVPLLYDMFDHDAMTLIPLIKKKYADLACKVMLESNMRDEWTFTIGFFESDDPDWFYGKNWCSTIHEAILTTVSDLIEDEEKQNGN